MTKEQKDLIATKNGLAITPEGEYIGTKKNWNDFEDDCLLEDEIESDMRMTADEIENEQQKYGEERDYSNEDSND